MRANSDPYYMSQAELDLMLITMLFMLCPCTLFVYYNIQRKRELQKKLLAEEKEQNARREAWEKEQAIKHAEAEARERELAQIKLRTDAENFLKAGRYEAAARNYEWLGDWEKAGECRKLGKTTYVVSANVHIGKEGISVDCPHCGASQPVKSKTTNEATCAYCGKIYIIPEKVLSLL